MDFKEKVVVITGASAGIGLETARTELAGDNIRVITFYPRRTSTEFGAHSIGDEKSREVFRRTLIESLQASQSDSAEFVAGKILEAAISEEPEIFIGG